MVYDGASYGHSFVKMKLHAYDINDINCSTVWNIWVIN